MYSVVAIKSMGTRILPPHGANAYMKLIQFEKYSLITTRWRARNRG